MRGRRLSIARERQGAARRERARLSLERRSARLERVRARLPRIAFVSFLGVTSLVGLREIVLPEGPPAAPAPAAIEIDNAAEQFGQRFARAYLSFDPARPERRERALAELAPAELDVGAGSMPARGRQTVSWTEVAQNQRAAGGSRVIVVAAAVGGRVTYLAVPVRRLGDGRLQLGGYPAIVGPPLVATDADLPEREEVADSQVVAAARRAVENYLAGELRLLKADLAPGVAVSLPPKRYRLTALRDMVWTDGTRDPEGVLVTVDARDSAGSTYVLTYELGIDRRGGRPVVTFIETAPTEP